MDTVTPTTAVTKLKVDRTEAADAASPSVATGVVAFSQGGCSSGQVELSSPQHDGQPDS